MTDRFGNGVFGVLVDVHSDDDGSLTFYSTIGSGQPEITNNQGLYGVAVNSGSVSGVFSILFLVGPSALDTEFLRTVGA